MEYLMHTLANNDITELKQLLEVFAEAFEDAYTYQKHPPSDAYLHSFLGKPHTIVLVAVSNEQVVGGLVAYELEKFEQERKEIYIYDLAVASSHRRQGIATALINQLKAVARERGAYVIFVQADHGDEPAIKLYESHGTKEEVLHFDIQP